MYDVSQNPLSCVELLQSENFLAQINGDGNFVLHELADGNFALHELADGNFRRKRRKKKHW